MSPVDGKALISHERAFSCDLQVVVRPALIKINFIGTRSSHEGLVSMG